MSFLELPRFPEGVSYGFLGGPEYNTEVVVTNSGDESRNQVWTNSRHKYEASHAARLPAQWRPLKAFFHTARGRANGFRLKDFTDFQCPDGAGTGVLAQGIGTGEPILQMGKKYSAGANSTVRAILKPVVGATQIYKNGVLQLLTTHYDVDESTGLVSFVPLSSVAITGITIGDPTVIHTAAPHGVLNGGLAWIGAIIGAWPLRNRAFEAANVTSTTLELAGIDSTSYGEWQSGGTVERHPQPSDILTWTGEFDVPCRFDTDEMRGEVIDRTPSGELIVGWQSIPIVEIRFRA